ncbi:MAG: GNAT family N-acetyltransferase [Planctomycetes bacterium]|nr:GNAT family N-acetyltransferase [Planctomycetota bacterium]
MSLSPLHFSAVDPQDPALEAFLIADPWPFHGTVQHSAESVAKSVASGAYEGPDNEPHWIWLGAERVGLVVFRELEDPTPVFDLRLVGAARGRGLGGQVLAWLAKEAFGRHGKRRLEGHTRADNLPMRRCFERLGWQQEAHYRAAWPDPAGTWHDATAYAILATEWAGGPPVEVPLVFPPAGATSPFS